ncbi:uncharacterized protein LOC108679314 [Hyalella azteca]|uniref:Uncharacterized protein LOC108679314 n=1 Tax=Hyalella azteca TaxID=294128 RepID=A0A8B7PCJ7_HYAAZ|nr:uncharacterized protein LOC108679314 [Hyalella azteca]
MDSLHEKPRSKKRKFVIESVENLSVQAMLAHPALVRFRTTPPELSSLTTTLEREPYVEGDRPGRKYISRLTLNDMDGKVYSGQNQLCRHSNNDICLVGIANKKTGKMRLLEAEEFLVSPEIDLVNNEPDEVNSPKKYNATVLFGTKKNRLKHKVLMEEKDRRAAELTSSVEKARPLIEKTTSVVTSSSSDNSYFLPPINTSAKTVDEVYNMSDIVEDYVLEHLIDEASALLETKGLDTEKVRPLFMQCLAGARLETDDEGRLRYACAAIYVEYLCRIVSGVDLPLDNMDDAVVEHLKNTYKLTKKARFLPPEMIHKALANIMQKFEIFIRTPDDGAVAAREKDIHAYCDSASFAISRSIIGEQNFSFRQKEKMSIG